MKLRVRVRKQTGRLELEEEQLTLGDLRKKLAESFLPSLGYSSETTFTITLNGKEPLTEDQDTLQSCGIISGDLIVVLLPDSLPPTAQIEHRLDSPAAPDGSTSTATKRQKSHEDDVGSGTPSTCMAGSSAASSEVDMSSEEVTDAKLTNSTWELMLCNEAVSGQIPHSLEILYHAASCTCASDALIVVIHLLMLETGYLQQGADTKTMCMPEEWRNGGVYKLSYSHPLCSEGSATLSCVPMGKLIIVNATLKINGDLKSVKRLQLSTDSYISFPEQDDNVATVYKDLQKLSRLFKDQLVYPLLAATRQVLDLPDVFGLVVLPLELKLRIFRLLDVQSILSVSASCRDLWADTGDRSLWRFLYMRDFRDPIPRSRDTDWKELYKKKHKQKLETLRWRHMFFLPSPPHPLPFHPSPYYPDPFPPNPNYPPGIIGGEYDQRPILPIVDPITSLIPGIGPTSGRFPPLRPHFDPFGPLAEPNPTLPGRNGARPSRGRASDIRRGFI
ncbi:F-box only protein 7 isoform 1-T2 [Discoglossus pictus]